MLFRFGFGLGYGEHQLWGDAAKQVEAGAVAVAAVCQLQIRPRRQREVGEAQVVAIMQALAHAYGLEHGLLGRPCHQQRQGVVHAYPLLLGGVEKALTHGGQTAAMALDVDANRAAAHSYAQPVAAVGYAHMGVESLDARRAVGIVRHRGVAAGDAVQQQPLGQQFALAAQGTGLAIGGHAKGGALPRKLGGLLGELPPVQRGSEGRIARCVAVGHRAMVTSYRPRAAPASPARAPWQCGGASP